ncbi:MAG: hypothetical protein PHF64_10365, partial [Methanoregula sp.]|nr:hypothetical protein [Methanoregula sp.]
NVTAIDKDSGNRRTVKMESRSRLSKKDKNKWMKSLMGSESVHVDIKNTAGKVTLDMFLNPTSTVSDLKRELREKGLIGETDTIAVNDVVPEDSQRIAGLNLDNDSVLVVRESDGK